MSNPSFHINGPCRLAAAGHGCLGLARWLLAVVVAATTSVLMASPALAKELRIAVSIGPVSLPIYVAQAQNLFVQEGVDVRSLDCSSGRHCLQMQAQGQADLATAAELPVTLNSLAGGLDASILATISSSSRHIKLVARAGAGFKLPSDLRGKRIATVAGTSAQYFLDSWLVFHQIDPADVRLTMLASDQLMGALTRQEVDAIAIWEPVASEAIAALGAGAVVMPSPRIYTQHFTIVASREAIASQEAAIGRVLRALARAEQFIANQPVKAARILAARVPGRVGEGALSEHDFRLTLNQSLITTMDSQVRWAVRQGLISGGTKSARNLLHKIDAEPLRKAAPTAVTLVK